MSGILDRIHLTPSALSDEIYLDFNTICADKVGAGKRRASRHTLDIALVSCLRHETVKPRLSCPQPGQAGALSCPHRTSSGTAATQPRPPAPQASREAFHEDVQLREAFSTTPSSMLDSRLGGHLPKCHQIKKRIASRTALSSGQSCHRSAGEAPCHHHTPDPRIDNSDVECIAAADIILPAYGNRNIRGIYKLRVHVHER